MNKEKQAMNGRKDSFLLTFFSPISPVETMLLSCNWKTS